MYSNRQRNQNRNRPRDPLERRMDDWLETGRQFVDGVAGNRPGQRKSGKPLGEGLDNVGRWVGDKLDWFFEEEEDWIEPWELEQRELKVTSANKKRPLEAISLRGTKSIGPTFQGNNFSNAEDYWPDESSFQVNKWERPEAQDNSDQRNSSRNRPDSQEPKPRRLPRSSRRRS